MSKTDWFIEAKYGLFIHWGLYTLLGGEWKGELSPHQSEWIMRYMQIQISEYKELAAQFNPQRFDPEYYVRSAKEWGMKYIVVTAKHHDGFAMYDTKVSDFNVMKTPYGKDIIKQFADACAKEGMIFCVYYSQMQDWEDPDGFGNTWDYNASEQKFERYFYGKCLPQVKELLTNYGKIGLIWFDTPYDMPKDLCRELADTVRQCQNDCLINGRIGYNLGDYRQMADNSIPVLAYRKPWESPMTLNQTWGYSKRDHNWKSSSDVLSNLAAITGKGGNLLLNIGPDGDGIIPEESVRILKRVGDVLAKNGESVYGTKAAPDFPYHLKWGNITYRSDKNSLYLHVIKCPEFPYRISFIGLKSKVLTAKLLCSGEPLRFIQSYEKARDEYRLYVYLPETRMDPELTVVALEIEGEPEVESAL